MDINNEIAKLNWKREPYGLYEPIEDTLAAGGKRVRPQLAMIACQMFGGKEEEVKEDGVSADTGTAAGGGTPGQ